MGIKKMDPNGEQGRNQSLHKQEKLAKNEIKYHKWDDRRKTFKKIPVIHNLCKSMADRYKNLSIKEFIKAGLKVQKLEIQKGFLLHLVAEKC